MSARHVLRTLNRIARCIIEDNTDELPIVLAGIDERGSNLSSILFNILDKEISAPIHHCRFQNGAFQHPEKLNFDGTFLVIFDDVIFSGKTMFTAFHKALDIGEPDTIKLAALIDRGHRKFPVEAQYIGKYSPTKLREHVQCKFSSQHKPLGIDLVDAE